MKIKLFCFFTVKIAELPAPFNWSGFAIGDLCGLVGAFYFCNILINLILDCSPIALVYVDFGRKRGLTPYHLCFLGDDKGISTKTHKLGVFEKILQPGAQCDSFRHGVLLVSIFLRASDK
ncbi:hypothetical protein ASC93_19710 [Massilia sp. Root335]|nr:hypothetical protein ASC93_19710 [Massilia sp. Root335]